MQDSEYVRTSYTRSCMVVWLLVFVEPRSLNLFTFHVFYVSGYENLWGGLSLGGCEWFSCIVIVLLVDDLTLANIFSRLCWKFAFRVTWIKNIPPRLISNKSEPGACYWDRLGRCVLLLVKILKHYVVLCVACEYILVQNLKIVYIQSNTCRRVYVRRCTHLEKIMIL